MASPTSSSRLLIITSNVRFDPLSSHPIPIPSNGTIQSPRRHWTLEDPYKERPWAERRSRLVDALGFWGADVIGFQEVLHNQLLDIHSLLGPRWASVGVGRDDGREAGEYSPIFYNTDRFEEISWGTKWLSKHPDQPGSKDWDAAQTRIATFLTLRDKSSKSTRKTASDLIHLVNTHYDDQGKKSRGRASWIIRELMNGWVRMVEADFDDSDFRAEVEVEVDHERDGGIKDESEGYQQVERGGGEVREIWGEVEEDMKAGIQARGGRSKGEGLVVWMGDFNAPTDDPKEEGYTHAISRDPLPHSKGDDMYFLDTRLILNRRQNENIEGRMSAPYGHKGTYTGFTHPGCEVDDPIDLVLVASTRSDRRLSRKSVQEQEPWSAQVGEGEEEEDLTEGHAEGIRGGWEVEKYGVIDNVIGGKGDEKGWVGRWSDHRAVGVELRKRI